MNAIFCLDEQYTDLVKLGSVDCEPKKEEPASSQQVLLKNKQSGMFLSVKGLLHED